jgi:hypothetical protein
MTQKTLDLFKRIEYLIDKEFLEKRYIGEVKIRLQCVSGGVSKSRIEWETEVKADEER